MIALLLGVFYFTGCMLGPGAFTREACVEVFDVDGDFDVDLRDWAKYANWAAVDECTVAEGGTAIRVCQIAETSDGALWEFPQPLSGIYFLIEGPEAQLRMWSERDAIGDPDAAAWFPHDGPVNGRYGVGVSFSDGIVAVEVMGEWTAVPAVEDVVYLGG